MKRSSMLLSLMIALLLLSGAPVLWVSLDLGVAPAYADDDDDDDDDDVGPNDGAGDGGGLQLLDGTNQQIGTVLDVSPGQVKVLVVLPNHPRAIVLSSITQFGVTTFQRKQTVWFTQDNCVGTGYGTVNDVTQFRTPELENPFVGTDNTGASRLYIGDEVPVAEVVETRSHLGANGCFNVAPLMQSLAPLILLDPDLLTTFPLPHTLIVPSSP